MNKRPRRLRVNQNMRDLVRETRLSAKCLVYPLFIVEGENIVEEISSLKGQYRYSPDRVSEIVQKAMQVGVTKFILFGIPKEKDSVGSGAYAENGIIPQGIKAIKSVCREAMVITDVCMCEYTSHGHCGILCGREVENDTTLDYLAKIALSHARAGADMVAPSDMMDGRIAKIREVLDENGYQNIPIMSYAVKYASSFYGPFRDAAGSAPSFGDRKSYQMDYHNAREGLKEAELDEEEGADILMVKPALSYLDVVAKLRERTNLPIAVYSVSGEYAMMKMAGEMGIVEEYGVMCESTISMARAGADIIISYYALEIARAIERGDIG